MNIRIMIITILMILVPKNVYCNESIQIEEKAIEIVGNENIENINDVLNQNNDIVIDYEKLFVDSINGNLDLNLNNIIDGLYHEIIKLVKNYSSIISTIILIIVISSFLTSITDSLGNKGASTVASFILYVTFITTVINNVYSAVSLTNNLLIVAEQLLQVIIPIYMTMLVVTLHSVTATAFSPILIFLSNLIIVFYKNILINVIFFTFILSVTNYIYDKSIMSTSISIIQKGIKNAIKYTTITYMAIVSIAGFSAPISDNIIANTSKYTLKSIPVLGNTVGGAIDLILSIASGVSFAIVLIIVVGCIIFFVHYVLPIIVLNITFYVTNMIAGAISDIKIVNTLNSCSFYFEMLIGVSMSTFVMLIYSMLVLVVV